MALIRKLGTTASIFQFCANAAIDEDRHTPESLVEFAFRYRGIAPAQVRNELLGFASIVAQRKPKAILEIGTRTGGTFFVLCHLAQEDATVISLDLPGGRFGGDRAVFRTPILRRMKRADQRLYLLRADSHDPNSRQRVADILHDSHLDLLFIDGDHSYEGVKMDFQMYSPFVRAGGIIAFHDIVKHPAEADCAVDRFWHEIKHNYPHHEIIENPNQGWAGIGILFPQGIG